MNNLLRTLTESQVKPSADLRLLLTSVKEGRKQGLEQKLTDGFYDSLEGLLNDLRTITIDNRDAEAFLRPVARSEVPDYYDVIVNPMDFQTMLRKVKSKQYKSKREFQDDLDLIWSNCYTYNAAENHPLRRCVDRLKVKAEKLLKYITDRKERTDPPLPSNLPASTTGIARPRMTNGLNGHLNGYGSHSRSSSITSKPNTPTSSTFFGGGARLGAKRMGTGADTLFAEMPALVRTQEGMKLYMELEEALDSDTQGADGDLAQRLKALATFVECEDENGGSPDPAMKIEDGMDIDDALAGVGDKRKQNGFMDKRPKKRAKLINPYPVPLSDEKDETTQLWWAAIQSDLLIANALPAIPFGPSSSNPRKPKKKKVKQPTASTSTNGVLSSPTKGKKSTIVKKEQEDTSLSALQTPPPPPPMSISASASMSGIPAQLHSQPSGSATAGPSNPKSILAMMNTNIKTMRRVRHTHSKFMALNATSAAVDDEEGGVGGAGAGDAGDGAGMGGMGGGGGGGGSFSAGMGAGMNGPSSPTAAHFAALDDEVVNDKIDEAPWGVGRGFVGGGPEDARRRRRKEKGKDRMVVDVGESVSQIQRSQASESGIPVGGIELGQGNANDCMRWAGGKILEHVGFQGTSKVALDVFADLTAEYLQNVGRTMRFLTDKFGHTMNPEEIILHTLFESGISKVQDVERFIFDDIERYGNRLGEVEKKLVNAYREATAGDVLEDEGLFEEEDEDEVGALATGEFADFVGDDFFGLGELGIAAELGLSALTVPKRLLKGKKGANKPTAAKPTEPPPPYPPPPPFVPLTAAKVEDQIGLLQAFYTERFKTLAATAPPPPPPVVTMAGLPSLPGPVLLPPPLAGPMIPGISAPPAPALTPTAPPPAAATETSLPPNTLPSTTAIGPAPPVAPPSPVVPPDLVLPDDGPTTAQMKMGPLGQITRTSGMGSKKKAAAAAAAAAAASAASGGGGGGEDKKKTNGLKT